MLKIWVLTLIFRTDYNGVSLTSQKYNYPNEQVCEIYKKHWKQKYENTFLAECTIEYVPNR